MSAAGTTVVAAAPPFTDCMPYAIVPDALRDAYGFLNGCAIYFCMQVELLLLPLGSINRQPAVAFVTSDSIFIGSEKGIVYRRVLLSKVCGIFTNTQALPPLSSVTSSSSSLVLLCSSKKQQQQQHIFTAFLLSKEEQEDLVIAGLAGCAAAVVVERLLVACGRCNVTLQRQPNTTYMRLKEEGHLRLPRSFTPSKDKNMSTVLATLCDAIPPLVSPTLESPPASVARPQTHLVATLAYLLDAERRVDAASTDGGGGGVLVPPVVRRHFPPFQDVLLFWGGIVALRSGVKQQPLLQAVLYITPAQLVVVCEKKPVRVMSLGAISRVLVHTIDAAQGRQFIAFISRSKDVDVCIEAVEPDCGVLLRQLHAALCAYDQRNTPPVATVASTKGLKLRLKPPKKYQLPTVAVPPTSERVQCCNYVFLRVSDIFRRCEPSRLDKVAMLMEEYVGRELELLNLLYNKYPDYAMLQERRSVPDSRERLIAFCERYIPDSLCIVDDVLRCYEGREEELFRHLVQRYGPELREEEEEQVRGRRTDRHTNTLTSEEIRERLVYFYRKYEPTKIADVDAIMAEYAGHEQLLFDRLTQMYGPMPPIPTVAAAPSLGERKTDDRPSWRERFDAFFARYAPQRGEEVEELLQKYSGYEDALLYGLEARYGPEPLLITRRNRARVAAFFLRVGLTVPEEPEIDEIIRSFRGSEEEFFFYLQQRYGGEHPLHLLQEPQDITAAEFAKVDLLTEIPFVGVPEILRPLFPGLCDGRAALLWFGRVLHWEQPAPPTLSCAYLTSSHAYVGNSEADTRRCVALEQLEAVYINSRRDRIDLMPCLLLKIRQEHDLFLAFASDKEAEELLWVLVSVMTQYHFGQRCRVLACSSLTHPSIKVDCTRPLTYVHRVAAVVRRPPVTSTASTHMVPTPDDNGSKPLEVQQRECELRSRLHDAFIRRGREDCNILMRQDAAMMSRGRATVRDLMARQTKMFGSASRSPLQGGVGGSNSGRCGPLTMPGRSPPPSGNFAVVFNAASNLEKLNPLQRAQFTKHSPNGTYGLGRSGAHCGSDVMWEIGERVGGGSLGQSAMRFEADDLDVHSCFLSISPPASPPLSKVATPVVKSSG